MIEPTIEQIQIEQPPCEIAEFLDRLRQNRQRIIPGSLVWLPRPEKPGRMVAAVMIEDIDQGKRGD